MANDVELKKRYDDLVREHSELTVELDKARQGHVGRTVVVAMGASALGFMVGYVAGVLRLGRS